MINKTLMRLRSEAGEMPIRSTLMVRAEFVELSGTTAGRVDELLDMGWLVPTITAESAQLFRPVDVYKLRKLERLCTDFELHTLAGTIVVDLLERIEELERQLKK